MCSCVTPNERRTAWDAKDGIIGRRNWDSGLTIQEYSELKELPYESMRPASPMVRRKRDFLEWEFTKKMNAVRRR